MSRFNKKTYKKVTKSPGSTNKLTRRLQSLQVQQTNLQEGYIVSRFNTQTYKKVTESPGLKGAAPLVVLDLSVVAPFATACVMSLHPPDAQKIPNFIVNLHISFNVWTFK